MNPIVNLLSETILKLILEEYLKSKISNSEFDFSDWYPKYGSDEKYWSLSYKTVMEGGTFAYIFS